MVRGLHDNCCANQTLVRPCRFSSARIASPMCGSSFMQFALCRASAPKSNHKESVETFCITFRCGLFLDYHDREVSTKSSRQLA
ncbi:MAG: hypothetical protein IJT04_06960 [Bacteroidales bacterium]|nr:hypothetical protein [Bacteroidales bacterium]